MIVALFACALLQFSDPPSGSVPAPGQEAWLPVSGLSLIVNEDCITPREIQRTTQRLGQSITSAEERVQLYQRVASELIRAMLAEQAGKDLGFDPALVDRLVRDELEHNVERAGSVSRLAERLQKEDLDSFTYREDATGRIYRQLWEGSIDGAYPGPGGRAYVDRYVRPGRLYFEHRRRGEGAKLDEKVVLQQLLLDPRHTGRDLDGTRELALELLNKTKAGEDLGELVEEYRGAAPGTKGVLNPLPVDGLATGFPELATFLAGAQEGDLSDVLAFSEKGEVRAYYFVKLLERRGGQQAEFRDPDYQQDLSKRISNAQSTYRRETGLRSLVDAAYVWPPEAFGRAKPGEETQAPSNAGGR